MILNDIAKKLFLTIFSLLILFGYLHGQDKNILVYKDRGITYYPRYVYKGLTKIGKASWYGKQFHKRLTASGERYNMYSMTAAHRTYALNTILKVTNLDNKKSVRVRVNDRGPFYHSRDIDLSYGAAKRIGLTQKGVARVKIEVISSGKHRQVKKRNRRHNQKYKRSYRVQLASFFDKKYANIFKKRHKLKNAQIIPTYIKSKRKMVYRVIVKCTPWEAKRFIKSKKFNGAYIIS